MLRGHDIVCVSSIDWDFIWQGHQEIMAAFAASGNRVVFIENTGVRPPTFRDLPRIKHRFLSWWKSAWGFREERPNLFVYSPLVLPFPYSRVVRRINRFILLRALSRWMRVVRMSRPVLWTFLPTPLAHDIIDGVNPDVTVYYCIDSFAVSSARARRVEQSEREMFRRADLVFVTSNRLREVAEAHNPNVALFPFGVDFERFDAIRRSGDALPEELRDLPRPIVGYVGGLHRWVDQALVAAVAERHPEWSIVLIGPVQTDVSALQRCANVHLLGSRAHADVPRYVKAFDVAMIPYVAAEYTHHVYPTKLNEYLAMGKPVISTDLEEIRHFNKAHDGVVAIATDPGGFADEIERARRTDSPEARQFRIAVAAQNGWRRRIDEMSRLITARSEQNRSGRGTQWREALRTIYRGVRRRMAVTATVVLGTYLLTFHTPLVWELGEPLKLADPPRAADVIVVLAGGVGESGLAGEGYQERVKHAVDLYQAGYAKRMIFSSGYVYQFRESEVMRFLAVSSGVPADAILLETQSNNTARSAASVSHILRERGWRSMLLVSSPYHMRRASLTFRRSAPELEIVHAPVPQSRFYHRITGPSAGQVRGILHEYAGIAYYWLDGKI
jgi:uncharacterized SAM-binding protein YcdF (DUF218 family)/glycosyltransferase involved in cell wall biosynthesis